VKKAFLLDASSFQYRAFHASKERPTYTRDGVPNYAVNLFRTMLHRLKKEWKPDYLVAACDSRAETNRAKIYALYKAQRPQPPAEYLQQIPGFREVLRSEFIPVIEKDGYEADDIIGTLVQRNLDAAPETEVVIVSGDKDMAQLVGGCVKLLNTNTNTLLDENGVQETYGVRPEQIVDYLAMVGDTSDNVPGANGMGPKGAVTLLRAFGTLDAICRRASEITDARWRHAIQDNLEMIDLSRRLVKIDRNVPLEGL
jgi:DNA polymerase I